MWQQNEADGPKTKKCSNLEKSARTQISMQIPEKHSESQKYAFFHDERMFRVVYTGIYIVGMYTSAASACATPCAGEGSLEFPPGVTERFIEIESWAWIGFLKPSRLKAPRGPL